MPLITVEKATSVKAVIAQIIEQSETLFGDIVETAKELARLWDENAEQRREIAELNETVTRLESQLDDANMRLESIFLTAKADPPPAPAQAGTNRHDGQARSNGTDRSADAASAGLAALEHLAARP